MIFHKSVFPQVSPGEAAQKCPIPRLGDFSPLGKRDDLVLPQAEAAP